MKLTTFPLHVLPFVLATLVAPSTAHADRAEECKQADKLFSEGVALRGKHAYAEALSKFEESRPLCPTPNFGPLYNVAQCEEMLERVTVSYLHYAEFRCNVKVTDERLSTAEVAMTNLRSKGTPLRLVNLNKLDRATSISVDGVSLCKSMAGDVIPVEPGEHVVVIHEPGSSERRLSVTVVRGEPHDVDVFLPPPAVSHGKRNAGFVVGSVGITSLLAGAITGGFAWYKRDQFSESCTTVAEPCSMSVDDQKTYITQNERYGTASTATFIIGGALTAIGVALVLWPAKPTSKEVALAPLVLPGGGGVTFSSQF